MPSSGLPPSSRRCRAVGRRPREASGSMTGSGTERRGAAASATGSSGSGPGACQRPERSRHGTPELLQLLPVDGRRRCGMTQPVIRAMDDANAVPVERARGATDRGPDRGPRRSARFATRRFTLSPGGRIPCHRHDEIEHEQLVLEGAMVIGLDDRESRSPPSTACSSRPGSPTGTRTAAGPVRFLCMVPRTERYQTEWLEPRPIAGARLHPLGPKPRAFPPSASAPASAPEPARVTA